MARTNTPDPTQVDREKIKARLTELKVEFNGRAQTPSLQELLVKAEADAANTSEEPPATTTEPEKLQGLDGGALEPAIVAAEAPITPVQNAPTAAAAPEIVVSQSKGSTVLIANQHAGTIVMPRKGPGGIVLPPLQLPPGRVTTMDSDLWAHFKTMPMVQRYLDHRLLAEVEQPGTVATIARTSDPIVPEHLQTEKEIGAFGAAEVDVKNVGEIKV